MPEEASIAAITLAELAAGDHAAHDSHERAVRQERLQRVEATLEAIPFDADAARAYGRVFAAVMAGGRKARWQACNRSLDRSNGCFRRLASVHVATQRISAGWRALSTSFQSGADYGRFALWKAGRIKWAVVSRNANQLTVAGEAISLGAHVATSRSDALRR